MKIISPFHDYYDSALVHYDGDVIYLRTPAEITIENKGKDVAPLYLDIYNRFNKYLCSNFFYNTREYVAWEYADIKRYYYTYDTMIFKRNGGFTLQEHKFLVIFCGKIYPAVEFTKTLNDYNSTIIKTIVYTESAFLAYLAEQDIKLKSNKDYAYLTNFYSISGQSIETEFLITNKITNIILEAKKLLINPKLSLVDFFKVLDVYSCYQELEMWMAGTLSYPQNMMIEVKDESKIKKHGFDEKYGFRTRPKEIKK